MTLESAERTGGLRAFLWILTAVCATGFLFWLMWGSAVVERVAGWESVRDLVQAHRRLWPEVRTDEFYTGLGWWTGLRYLLFVTLLMGVCAWKFDRIASGLRSLLTQPASPALLAALRFLVFGSMILYTLSLNVGFFLDLPRIFLHPPIGWGWLSPVWPPNDGLAAVGMVLLFVSCLSAALGLGFRYMGWAALALFILIAGIPQFYGKINHYHHLVWAAAILAAAPSAAVWSLDAWFRGRRADVACAENGGEKDEDLRLQAGFALRSICILIGLVYFFPGFWKLVIGGENWLWGEQLKFTLAAQWARTGMEQAVWLLDVPLLLKMGGLLAVAWEISFVFLLFHPRTRVWAIDGGILFHLAVWLFMGINFWSLAILYAAFLVFVRMKWSRSFDHGPAVTGPPGGGRPLLERTVWWTLGLIIAAGFLQFDSWPIGVYPSFAVPEAPAIETVEIVGYRDGVETVRVDPYRSDVLREEIGSSRIFGLITSLSGEPDPNRLDQKAEALARVLSDIDPAFAGTDSLSISNIRISTIPEK